MPITIKELLSRLAEAKAKSAKKTTDAPVEAPAKKVVAKTPAKRKQKVKPQPAAQEEPQTTTQGSKVDWDSPDAPFGSNFDKKMVKIVGDTKDSEYETLRAILKKNYPDKTDTQIDVELDKAGHKMPMPTDINDPDFAAKDALWKANQARLAAYKADPSANLANIDAQVAKTYGLGKPSKKSDAPVEEPVADIPSASSTPEPEPKVAEPEKKPMVGPETKARLQKNAGVEPEVVPSPDTTSAAEPTPSSTPGVRVSTEPTTPIPLDVVAEPDKPVAPAAPVTPVSTSKPSSGKGGKSAGSPQIAKTAPVASVPAPSTKQTAQASTSTPAPAPASEPTPTPTDADSKPVAEPDEPTGRKLSPRWAEPRKQPWTEPAPHTSKKTYGFGDKVRAAVKAFKDPSGMSDKETTNGRKFASRWSELWELLKNEGLLAESLTAEEWQYILTETQIGRDFVESVILEESVEVLEEASSDEVEIPATTEVLGENTISRMQLLAGIKPKE